MTEEGGWKGLGLLLKAYRERFFDASGTVPLPADFTNEADYQVCTCVHMCVHAYVDVASNTHQS
jgi:hypothetical protein